MYRLTMINRNGYTVQKENRTINSLKQFASFYPLSCFFAWIYDCKNNEIIYQNCYKDKWKKCNNNTFVQYY